MVHTWLKTRIASRRKMSAAAGVRRSSKSKPGIASAKLKKIAEGLDVFKQMVDFASHGCVIVDLKGNLLYVNDSFARMHGYDAGSLLGKNLKIFHNAKQLKHVRAINDRLKKTGKGLNNEMLWRKHRDGTVFPTLANNWLLRDKSGHPAILCATMVDISELKQRESELEASKKLLNTMLNTSGELIAMVDRNANLVDMNENMAKALGQPREKLIGRCSWDLLPPAVAAARRVQAEKVLATGKLVTFFDDGKRGRVFNTSYYPLRNLDGKVTGIVVFAKDVTEQKLSEAQAHLYREELLKLRRSAYLDLVSAMIGHQLSQPLTTINMLMEGTIEEIKNGELEKEKVTRVLKTCLRETKSAVETIQKVREHTEQWMKGRIERFSPDEVIKEVISTLESKATRAKVRIDAMDLKSLPTIPGYRNAFEQIVFTIAENAIEAADNKKLHRLAISAKKMDNHIELAFSDDCCGIPRQNLEKIFEPFYSTKASRGSKCLGLGLPITRRILTAMGGTIRVDSTAGKGATFYVSWPLS